MHAGDVLLEKYRIERELGAGGMGRVLLARHLELDQLVAIKVLRIEVVHPELVTRFIREARAAARIKSEHVVRVTDVGRLPEGPPYMVMEYLEGQDLEAALKERGSIPIEEAVDLLLQAMEAVAEAHAQGIVHRDLKPANLYLTRRSRGAPCLKVIDFGISKFLADGNTTGGALTQTQGLLGSPLYMSPEQLQSAKHVDQRTDLWALGAILYQLVSGRPPFVADTMPQLIAKVFADPPTPLAEALPGVPPAFAAVVHKCLEKRLEDRWANVGELATALAPFASIGGRALVQTIIQGGVGERAVATAETVAVPSTAASALVQTDATWNRTAHETQKKSLRGLAIGASVVALALALGGTWALTRGPTETAVPSAPITPSKSVAAAAPKTLESVTPSASAPPSVSAPPPAPSPSPSITPKPSASTKPIKPKPKPVVVDDTVL